MGLLVSRFFRKKANYKGQEAKESSASPDFKDCQLSLEKLFFKKEYLIEAHYYVKGLFNLHFPDSVKPSSIPKFGLCSEETGSTNQKNSTYKPSPIHTLSKDTKGSASEYNIWAYFGNNPSLSSSLFQRSPIIIVVR